MNLVELSFGFLEGLLLIEQDEGMGGFMFIRHYFQDVVILSLDEDPSLWDFPIQKEEKQEPSKMQIAFRYHSLPSLKTTIVSNKKKADCFLLNSEEEVFDYLNNPVCIHNLYSDFWLQDLKFVQKLRAKSKKLVILLLKPNYKNAKLLRSYADYSMQFKQQKTKEYEGIIKLKGKNKGQKIPFLSYKTKKGFVVDKWHLPINI